MISPLGKEAIMKSLLSKLGKSITGTHIGIVLIISFFYAQSCLANELYVDQAGDLLELGVVQDGTDNQIEGISGSGSAEISGNNKTVTFNQTGNTNEVRVWTHGGNQQMSLTQDGNSNISTMDNHGNNNNMSVDIDGNSNITHSEIGNGGDNDNNMSLTIDNGDSNVVYSEILNGDYNNVDIQIHKQDNNYAYVIVNGNSNNVKAWQGKHEDGHIDTDETGDNEVYWIVNGDSNSLASYQTDDNGNGGQHIANYITGDSNTVKHTQRGSGDHDGFIAIDGDSNDVELSQRGNGGDDQFADIEIDGDGHTVDVFQRYADHTANIDITNGGGAYTLDLEQTASSDKTYSLTGICTNASGCSVSVNQY